MADTSTIDYSNFDLTAAQGDDDLIRLITCYLNAGGNDYTGGLGESQCCTTCSIPFANFPLQVFVSLRSSSS